MKLTPEELTQIQLDVDYAALQTERRDFIKRAAIELYARSVSCNGRASSYPKNAENAVDHAITLWEAVKNA